MTVKPMKALSASHSFCMEKRLVSQFLWCSVMQSFNDILLRAYPKNSTLFRPDASVAFFIQWYNASHRISTWCCVLCSSCGYIIILRRYWDLFTHIVQGWYIGMGATVWHPQWIFFTPDKYIEVDSIRWSLSEFAPNTIFISIPR